MKYISVVFKLSGLCYSSLSMTVHYLRMGLKRHLHMEFLGADKGSGTETQTDFVFKDAAANHETKIIKAV